MGCGKNIEFRIKESEYWFISCVILSKLNNVLEARLFFICKMKIIIIIIIIAAL